MYEKVFPSSMGYEDLKACRPAEIRSGDKMPYIEVTLSDVIKLRKVAKMPWTDDFLPPK
jgi:hypothetical protein